MSQPSAGSASRTLHAVLLVALTTAGAGCPGAGERAFFTVEVVGSDGLTSVDAEGIALDVIGSSRPERCVVTLATWPELEPVDAHVEATIVDDGVHYEVEPASVLGARWHVVLVSLEPAASNEAYEISSSVALADGRVGFRVFGSSSPRIRSVHWRRSEIVRDIGIVSVFVSEPLEQTPGALPMIAILDDRWCSPHANDGLELSCFVWGAPPRSAMVEVRAPMLAIGGGTLEPQTIVVEDIISGFFLPVGD